MKLKIPRKFPSKFNFSSRSNSNSNSMGSGLVSNLISGPGLIAIAAVLWSLDGVLRGNLRVIPAASLVAIEHLLGLILLIPFIGKAVRDFQAASTSARLSLVVTAIISGALGTIFYTAAIALVFERNVPFSVVVLMQQLQPIFAIGLAYLVLGERPSKRFLVAAGFALFGAYLINFPGFVPDLATESGVAAALVGALALIAALSWGAGTVFSKSALKEIHWRSAATVRFAVTFVAAGAIAIALPSQRLDPSVIGLAELGQLLVIVFSAGLVALLIYYRGLSETPARVSTIAELAWPVSALAIDTLRGVEFSPVQVIGGILLATMIVRITRLEDSKDLSS